MVWFLFRNLPISPYCDKPNKGSGYCIKNASAYGFCDMIKHNKILPLEKQYFTTLLGVNKKDVSYYGCSSSFTDGCPMFYVSFNSLLFCIYYYKNY